MIAGRMNTDRHRVHKFTEGNRPVFANAVPNRSGTGKNLIPSEESNGYRFIGEALWEFRI